MKTNNLVACPECDALQREVSLPAGGVAQCVRCGGKLFREKPDTLDHTLACIAAAAVAFLCANTFPLMELDAQGIRTSSTLFEASLELVESGWPSVALLVFVTTILAPTLQLALALYLLVPLKLGFVPPQLNAAVRALDAIWPWGMLDVFLLGALVSLVKLTQLADVYTGSALYFIGAYIVLIASAVAAFEPRALWRHVEALRA